MKISWFLDTGPGLLIPLVALAQPVSGADVTNTPEVKSISSGGTVVASWGNAMREVKAGQSLGNWTLMAVLQSDPGHPLAAFEDFSQLKGDLCFLGPGGEKIVLPKSLEPTWAEPATLYRGHSLQDVFKHDEDLLGRELLAQQGDPHYADVAACFPPISKTYAYTFVGTHQCLEKVGVFYGGATPNFDPVVYVPSVRKLREQRRVLDGLVGGWLPVLRFVYPEKPGDWSELLIYAPIRVENGNDRVQPVWYRVSHVESNALAWVRYFDSYHPFPPRLEGRPEDFYNELLGMRTGWTRALESGMRIDIPDQRLADMARHSLVRDMITRVGAFPKYGVFDRGYGGSEHDGFPDTFTADTSAMLEWGLFDLAREYIDNYFTYFVRDDGSILYRGPETGQFGRMLTVAAQYADYTGDDQLLLRHRVRLDAIARLLLSLRAQALRRPVSDPAYGIISGWSEADACLDPEPSRYMQPYFSNNTEAARGFEELGEVWLRAGTKLSQPDLVNWGQKLREESRELAADTQGAIARSILTNTTPPCLPAIAGVKEPFDVAVSRDKLDPQFRSYRAYMEMLYSGLLTRDQVEMIAGYRAAHRDTILGIPMAYGYNTHELAGFLSYGHAYGLVQHDLVREYLLTLYSLMAHQYTRGTWTAPETRKLDPNQYAAPYCTPAQMTVPLLTRWMLVFEDPATGALWLAKASPRDWLQDGQTVSVTNAPTRFGPLSFKLSSRIASGNIEARLTLPPHPPGRQIYLRLRLPEGHEIVSVVINGQPWNAFDARRETVTLPAEIKGQVLLTANCR